MCPPRNVTKPTMVFPGSTAALHAKSTSFLGSLNYNTWVNYNELTVRLRGIIPKWPNNSG